MVRLLCKQLLPFQVVEEEYFQACCCIFLTWQILFLIFFILRSAVKEFVSCAKNPLTGFLAAVYGEQIVSLCFAVASPWLNN